MSGLVFFWIVWFIIFVITVENFFWAAKNRSYRLVVAGAFFLAATIAVFLVLMIAFY